MKNHFETYKNPLSILLLIVLAAGLYTYSQLQSSLFPDITFPKVKIIAENGLQPVEKMMVTVTKPLENAIKRVPNLEYVRSTTSRGSCELSAFMKWNSDLDLCKQQIESNITQISGDLPPGVKVSVEKMNPSILPVSGYILEAPSLSKIEANQLAIYTIKPYLSQVEGISEIRVIGGRTKEYHLTLNPQRMSLLGVTPQQISNILQQSNFIASNGYLTDYKRLYLTVTDANVQNLEELRNLILSNDGKRILRLSDVARVEVSERTEYTRINANGKSAALIAILKQPNSNLIEVSNAIKARIESLNHSILPKGVKLIPYYVQADFVQTSIRSVTDSLWIGLLLAIIVSLLFLRSFKSGGVILITIPITLSLSMIAIHLLGYNLNIMTIGAIAASIGLIIDDAIVVMEQIHRTHEEHTNEPSRKLVNRAVRYLFPAMVGSTLSTTVIFLPFILLSGVAGAYFKIMTTTMMVILLCSFFVTWIGLPVIYLQLSKYQRNKEHTPKHHNRKNNTWISFFICRPWISTCLILLFMAALIVVPRLLETGFLPEMDEGSIVLDYKTPPGTSLDETDRILSEVEKLFPQIPEIEAYSRRTGTQMGFFITEPNTGDYLIQLKPKRDKSTEEVINEIRTRIEASQPALQVDFGQVIGDMLGDLMSSTQPIEIKVFGNNQQELQRIARKVTEVVKQVNGTADVFNGITEVGPSVAISPNYQRLAQFGITPADFQAQLQAKQEGLIVGSIFEHEQQTPIRLIYPNASGTSLDDIKSSSVFLPNGKLQPLASMSTISITPGAVELNRENLQGMIAVIARLNSRDLGSVMKDIRAQIAQNITLPEGYHISFGGAYKEQQQSFKELILILLLAILLVFAVILFLFKRIRLALLIISIAILGISGSFIALLLTGTPLNVGSYTGIIMIVGIIGENAIFTYLQFKDSLYEASVEDAIVFAISTRLRPKLMTALGAIIALLPIALGIGAGAQLHQPLAIAVIGGFVVALPLLLIVYPTMLKILYKNYQIPVDVNED